MLKYVFFIGLILNVYLFCTLTQYTHYGWGTRLFICAVLDYAGFSLWCAARLIRYFVSMKLNKQSSGVGKYLKWLKEKITGGSLPYIHQQPQPKTCPCYHPPLECAWYKGPVCGSPECIDVMKRMAKHRAVR